MSDITDVRERPKSTINGIPMIFVFIALLFGGITLFIMGVATSKGADVPLPGGELLIPLGLLTGVLSVVLVLAGMMTIQPNQAVALTLFGDYVGTERKQGLRWANPFLKKHKISLRVRNFDSDKLKVNELNGSPVEIAAIVVWRVTDTAEALFGVDNYADFVHIQAESAIRQMATSYPYDGNDDPGVVSLRSHSEQISERLQTEIQGRLEKAGVEVMEARISHLAYAPEIAAAMLRRQQAGAIVAARAEIVEGAVGMVESALKELSGLEGMDLDPERRAQMASNLMVVLCGDRSPSPIVNAGTLY